MIGRLAHRRTTPCSSEDQMEPPRIDDKQPWAACYLTDILLSYVKENHGTGAIDCASLFRAVEGFETPADPALFLSDVNNWVPLAVLRELEFSCERLSGKKDVAYHAARAYFQPGKRPLPSLFEIILRVLNDIRLALVCANLWGSVQTNYLKLQAFEKNRALSELYMLAQFEQNATPTVGTMHLLTGICEGFPRLYPFIGDFQCIEEISQLQLQDIAREFPNYTVSQNGERLGIYRRTSQESVIEAVRIPLATETIPLSQQFLMVPEGAVVAPEHGELRVLTNEESANGNNHTDSAWGYKITRSGALTDGQLSYEFDPARIYNAPYSRFRVTWKETTTQPGQASVETVRRETSQLLFDHLKQIKHTQTRIVQYNIEKRRLTLENIQLRREVEREYGFAGIVGQSAKIKDLLDLVRSIAATDVTVLVDLVGEFDKKSGKKD